MDKVKDKFKYTYLNKMLYSSLSNDDTWFLESMIYSNYFDKFNDNIEDYYMYYISIYLYYLVKIESKTSDVLKTKISNVINKNLNDPNVFKFSWCGNLKFINDSSNDDFFLQLLDKLFYFRNLLYEVSPIYKLKERPVLIYNEIFDYDKTIIKCYIKILLNSNYEIDEIKNKINIESLTKNQKDIFENMLKKENIESINKDNDFIEFYHLENNNKDKNAFLKKYNQDIFEYSQKNIENIINSFKILNQNKIPYINNETFVEFKDIERNIVINDLNNYTGIHNLKKQFIKYFNGQLFEELEKLSISFKKIDDLKNILKKDSKDKNNVFYKNFDLKNKIDNQGSNSCLNKINDMETASVIFNKFIIWQKDAIKIEYRLVKEKCSVRKLKDEEINEIINAKHKNSDGFYNYKYKNNITQFITREDLFNEIQNNYWYISIFYEYYINIDSNNIYLPFES